MRKDELVALRERVAAAKGPDREIDALVHHAFYGDSDVPHGAYTGCSDSNIELAERHLPAIKAFAPGSPSSSGWKLTFYRGMTPIGAPHGYWQANIRQHASDGHDADAPTLPLAILSALLSALIAREASDANAR